MKNIPGFAAEASLFMGGIWKTRTVPSKGATARVIEPAAQCCAPCGKDLCCDECPSTGGGDDRPRFRFLRFRSLI